MQELILIDDVEALGRRGSLVRVRDGYARNFLLPQRRAVLATRDNLKRLEGLRKRFEEEEKERVATAKGLLGQLQGVSLTITMKASEEGHLYGSVNVAVIGEALTKQGIGVEPRAIRLAEPIKEVGVYQVPLALHDEVRTELKVYVVREAVPGEETAAAPAEKAGDAAAAGAAADGSAPEASA
jgi:large subunit ribosomal protein L9